MRSDQHSFGRCAGRLASVVSVLLVAGGILLGGCGEDEDRVGRKPASAVIGLDFTPNAVHAPIYMAVRNGYDRRHGVRLQIRPPGSSADALKLLSSGRADVAVLDIHDLGLARERGADVVGIAALVQRPLAALIARPHVERPRDLEGRTVGVSGLPSDPAFLRAIVEHDGGDYRSIRQVTIGFAAVSALASRKVQAVPAFWNAEGVALRQRGRRIREFRVEDYGAPAYPEVVLVTTRAVLENRRDDLQRFLAAVGDGVRSVLADSEAAAREIAREAGEADLRLVRAQLAAVRPLLDPSLALERRVLEQWAVFDARIGILKRRIDVDRSFAFGLTR